MGHRAAALSMVVVMDERILDRAERQHGAFSRQQLLADGVAPEQVSALLRRGWIVRQSYGTYTLRGSPATAEQEAMVAMLRCGPGARVVGERMLGFLGVRGASPTGDFTILTRPGRVVTGVDWGLRRDGAHDRDEATIRGIASVTPARNLLEAVVGASDGVVERLVDGVRWSPRGLGPVRSLLDHLPDHPGATILRDSGLVAPDAGESPPERRLFDLVAHHEPRRQVWVARTIRVDILLPRPLLVLEYHGRWSHTKQTAVADTDRRRAIQALGHAVLDVWNHDMREEDELVARIDALVRTLCGNWSS